MDKIIFTNCLNQDIDIKTLDYVDFHGSFKFSFDLINWRQCRQRNTPKFSCKGFFIHRLVNAG